MKNDAERRALRQKLAWAEARGLEGEELKELMGLDEADLEELEQGLATEDRADQAARYQGRRAAMQRLAWMMLEKDMTQTEIGTALRMKQGEISDLMREWEARPNTPTPSVQLLIQYVARDLGAPPEDELPAPDAFVVRRGRKPAPKAEPAPDAAAKNYNDIMRNLAFGMGMIAEENGQTTASPPGSNDAGEP